MKKRILLCAMIGVVLLSVVAATLIILHFRADCEVDLTTADFDLLMQHTSDPADTPWTQDVTDVSIGNYLDSTEESTTTEPTTTIMPTGRQFCVISAPFADTWSGLASDDTFTPMCTTLVQGTVDYITGQSRVYDEEEKEWRDFYLLASGRKVLIEAVQLLSPDYNYGDNSIQIVSSETNNGNQIIRFKSAWNAPYTFEFSGQNYYEKNGKHYFVNAFTADKIQFTFYHTTKAEGSVNIGSNAIVTNAYWTVDTANKTASLTMPLRVVGQYYGYTMQREADGTLVLTLKKKPGGIAGARIMLDPGHGGKDPGALGFGGAVAESQVNFALAVATKQALERRGATVYFTRTDDVYLSLEDRKLIARQANPDVFISIHCNAAENKSRYGTSTYYFRPMSQPLASAVYQNVLAVYQTSLYAGDAERRAKVGENANFHPFSVTRLEECPSILIETGYVTNDRECTLLLSADNRARIGEGIAAGVAAYLNAG
jgi:N-acetylmuramoyl-L-alanine amidase